MEEVEMNRGIFYAIAFSIFIVLVGAGGYTLRFVSAAIERRAN